jgi:hypothetical protein
MTSAFVAGAGKTILWYATFYDVKEAQTDNIGKFDDHRNYQPHAQVWGGLTSVLLLRF